MDFWRTSGNRSGLFPVRFGHLAQLPASGSRASSSGSNGVGDVQVDFPFNPLARLPHGGGFRFPVFQDGGCVAMSRKTFLQSALLVVRLQAGDFKRVRDGKLLGVKRLLRFFDFLRSRDFLGERFDCVGLRLELHQRCVAPRFIEFVHVGALQVFDDLQLETIRRRGTRRTGRQSKGWSTPCSRMRKVFLIVDGYPVHKSRSVGRWLAEHREQIQIFQLPSCSPKLNPDELLNQDVKTNALGRVRPVNVQEMMANVRSYLRITRARPKSVKNYFRERHVQYAAR
jgi:hypothetical protein